MKKILSVFAYIWASLGTLIILVAFIGMDSWQQLSLNLPFMRVDPQYSGGAIVDSVVRNNLKISIHENVFPGVFRRSGNGFVQIDVNQCPADTIRIDSLLINNKITTISVTPEKAEADGFEIEDFVKLADRWIIRLKIEK
ncbi:MAG: hypothetical protein II671_06465 [Salinivirgaceae bacterium]|nr:hypothetical protein [Salinivirgaceae bacterium]